MRSHTLKRWFSLAFILVASLTLAAPPAPAIELILSIGIAPPPLPIYEQPVCPGVGYIWTPGYWAYTADGYFWVPGTWVLIPEPGFLWTPGYWGWSGGLFVFHEGYWGPQIGFYGGVNYGFGYVGVGYEGGYWRNGSFFYNRTVNNVTNITNVYNKTVVTNVTVTNVSYNGGAGGITARPTPQEEAAAQARHIPPTAQQTSHVQSASSNHQLYESVNHGKPAIAATARPSQFSGAGVVAARAAAPSYKPVAARSAGTPGGGHNAAVHPNEVSPAARPAPPNTGNQKMDQKLQREQDALSAKQEKERQSLQQKQEQEHKGVAANSPKNQQLEQKHQQQTQKLSQKHAQEQQQLQQRQEKAAGHPSKP